MLGDGFGREFGGAGEGGELGGEAGIFYHRQGDRPGVGVARGGDPFDRFGGQRGVGIIADGTDDGDGDVMLVGELSEVERFHVDGGSVIFFE